MSCVNASFRPMKSYHETESLNESHKPQHTTQKVGNQHFGIRNSKIRFRHCDFSPCSVFVMIVHKGGKTVLSVLFASIVGIVSARGPQTVY